MQRTLPTDGPHLRQGDVVSLDHLDLSVRGHGLARYGEEGVEVEDESGKFRASTRRGAEGERRGELELARSDGA
jgi:hypothetical protein